MSDCQKLYHAGTLTYTRPQLLILFFWLLWGDLCFCLMETVVPTILPLKLKALGASNITVGLILTTLPTFIFFTLNPIISFKSDRYRSRWGRRIPFIFFTMPFLVACLIGVGVADKIGFQLYPYLIKFTNQLTPNQFTVLVIAVMMIIFTFFNTFVNSVFWYLFNDVVPEHLLARFMSWFRLISMFSGTIYYTFVFQYAESHMLEIFIGASVIYFVGFGLMCLNVKEGEYPPPPMNIDGQNGIISGLKTFGKECHSLSHYWYVFFIGMCIGAANAVGPFMLFFNQSIGLTLEMIGKINGLCTVSMGIMIFVSGWLGDKYHPVRIVIVGLLLQILIVLPAQMIFIFWMPSQQTAYYLWAVIALCTTPATALIGMLDPPLFMRIFPRERYGQFCSANALWRSIPLIIGGGLSGLYFDVLKKYVGERAFCYLPLWQFGFTILMLFFMVKLYKSWKKYGGDEAYVAPIPEMDRDETKEKLLHASA